MHKSGRPSTGSRRAPSFRPRAWPSGRASIPTTFNKSKRITPDGRARWPSTESVAKALAATGVSVETFVSLITDNGGPAQSVPLIGFAEAGGGGYFDDGGFPVGKGWDEIAFPAVNDENAYALEISGESMLPAYRDGDVIIVSPAAPVRRGDRVVVKTHGGEVMVKELKRQTNKVMELKSLNPEHLERVLRCRGGGLDRPHPVGKPVAITKSLWLKHCFRHLTLEFVS